jgi:hypothetical protein
MENYRSKHENVKMNFTCLVRVAADEEQSVLQNQLVALSQLWTNVQNELRDQLKLLIKLIENLEEFNRQFDIMLLWLNGIENAASNHGGLGTSPEKQKERIKHVSFLIYLEEREGINEGNILLVFT